MPIDDEAAGDLVDNHQIDDDAARTRWGGERLDRRWAIAVLAQRREHARPTAS